ncbi:hypothetical protein ACFO1B_14195 [Dactylosporangium siamense]|uniref:hypothetical protein n=1 Tax=Dactylosporangium siamense TaxID=685454 RepID=UPI001944A550|nr:hypothetical protein [Dactylosporangium siamense]
MQDVVGGQDAGGGRERLRPARRAGPPAARPLDVADDEFDSVAERVVAWWARSAPTVTGPDAPTPCPACGADPDQSTDPQNTLLSICYCGHPRSYDYKHQDETCPCPIGAT